MLFDFKKVSGITAEALIASRGWGWEVAVFLERSVMKGTAGDHEGPPNSASSSLTPTEVAGLFFG
jgi:hypothetical protein